MGQGSLAVKADREIEVEGGQSDRTVSLKFPPMLPL